MSFGFKTISAVSLALAKLTVDAKLTEASYFYRRDRPLIIAHRGSSG